MGSLSPTTNSEKSTAETERLQCMTVWGGNSATSRVFEVPGLRIWVYSKVYGDATSGGDVYFVSSCASGRLTRLLLADVSGHGAAVSQTADSLRNSMSANVNHINQEKLVRSVNAEFSQRGSDGGFATAIVSTYFAPTQKLTLSNAGHPPPLIFRQSTRSWRVMNTENNRGDQITNLPLGIIPETHFDQSRIQLTRGDMVLVYTDAFYESRNQNDEMLGTKGLIELLEDMPPSEPDRLIPGLIERISAYHPNNLTADDSTIILIQATGSKTPFWTSLTAPFRYLGSLLGLRKVKIVESETRSRVESNLNLVASALWLRQNDNRAVGISLQ